MHLIAVHPHVHRRCDRAQVQEDGVFRTAPWDLNLGSVCADGVVVRWRVRRALWGWALVRDSRRAMLEDIATRVSFIVLHEVGGATGIQKERTRGTALVLACFLVCACSRQASTCTTTHHSKHFASSTRRSYILASHIHEAPNWPARQSDPSCCRQNEKRRTLAMDVVRHTASI